MFDFSIEDLRQWFLKNKRDLPWRAFPTPYTVLVSEVMLQQTQVSVVIPYYQRWMTLFPTLEALAESKEEEVLKAWEGLGYYSRARRLRNAAIFISEKWQGKMPRHAEELATIPGIGAYTFGAICSFAFKEKRAAVDGNVMRVLSRYFAIEEDISKSKGQEFFRKIAEKILPENEPWVIAEALIELGALICKKKPICSACPLLHSCKAHQQNLVEKFPLNSRQLISVKLHRMVPILMSNEKFLIQKVPAGKVMADLHEFPYFEGQMSLKDLQDKIKNEFKLEVNPIGKLPLVKHSFTKYRVNLEAYFFNSNRAKVEGFFWGSYKNLSELAFSSGHRKLVNYLLKL